MKAGSDNRSSALLLKVVLTGAILVGVMIFMLILFQKTTNETMVTFTEKTFEIEGMFGATYKYDAIEAIELKNTIPNITRKNNGSGIGEVRKGNFEVEGLGECKLFTASNAGPFLYIKTNDSYVIINYKDKNKTEQLYEDLSSRQAK